MTATQCVADGCDQPAISKGMCNKHYYRMRRHGTFELPPREKVECGTYAGYNRHKAYNEQPCESCKKAAATYMREWRKKTGDPRGHATNRARARALTRLGRIYPDLLQQLIDQELHRESVDG